MADDSVIDSGTATIAGIIRARALANGVDPAILLRMAQNESSLNPSLANPSSSAKGLFQFIDGTWGKYGKGDPLDPVASADAGARFLADNSAGLRSAGHEVTPGNAYLAHFAGLGGARSVLGADPAASAADVLGPAAAKANPFLAKMTVADLRAWADRKMGAGGAPMAQRAPMAPGPVAAATGVPGADSAVVPPAATAVAGTDDQLLKTLQSLSGGAQQQEPAMKAPEINIHYAKPKGLELARALALAMGKSSIA